MTVGNPDPLGGSHRVMDRSGVASNERQHGDVARQDVHGSLVGRACALVNTGPRLENTVRT
jgi:hypothetical protein